MAKFVYGSLPRVYKAKGFLPGQITKYFGPKYIASGFLDSANQVQVEFGEFAEVNAGDQYAYEVLPVSATTTAGELAVRVRDVVGAPTLENGIIETSKKWVPLSLFMGTSGQKGKIVAILGEQATTPSVGGQVYVGTGATSATVAGVIYTTNVGTECIEATGWTFAGTKFAPTTSGNYVIEVQYAG